MFYIPPVTYISSLLPVLDKIMKILSNKHATSQSVSNFFTNGINGIQKLLKVCLMDVWIVRSMLYHFLNTKSSTNKVNAR